ncbi:MAG: GAF domain-containing protein, partial [Dehalococcoidia bacterium]
MRVDTQARTYTPVFRWGRISDTIPLFVPRSYTDAVIEKLVSSRASFALQPEDFAVQNLRRNNTSESDPYPDLVAWADSPILIDGDVIGAIQIRSNIPDAYQKPELELLDNFSQILARPFFEWSRFQAAISETVILRVLANLGQITTSTLDLSAVYDEIANCIADAIPYDTIAIKTISENREQFTTTFTRGEPASGPQVNIEKPIGDIFHLMDSGNATIVIDQALVDQHPSMLTLLNLGKSTGLHSWMITPLIWEDQIIGSLHFRHREPNKYGINQQRYASLIADQISGAFASTRQYQNELIKQKFRTALANITLAVSQDLNLKHIYQRVATELKTLLTFDRLAVVIRDRQTSDMSVRFVEGLSLPSDARSEIFRNYNNETAWQTLVSSYREMPETDRDRELAELGLKSWIQAPIGMNVNGPDGFLSLRSCNENQYSEADAAYLAQVAAQITSAIQNATLYEQSVKLNEHKVRADRLNEENSELTRIADARSAFLSTVSHELRTPLTVISAFSDILSHNTSGNLGAIEIDQIEVIRRSATGLKELINDLLDVSLADRGSLTI